MNKPLSDHERKFLSWLRKLFNKKYHRVLLIGSNYCNNRKKSSQKISGILTHSWCTGCYGELDCSKIQVLLKRMSQFPMPPEELRRVVDILFDEKNTDFDSMGIF